MRLRIPRSPRCARRFARWKRGSTTFSARPRRPRAPPPVPRPKPECAGARRAGRQGRRVPAARHRCPDAEQPPDHLHRRRLQLRRADRAIAFRYRDVRLPAEQRLDGSATLERWRQRASRASRRAGHVRPRLRLRPRSRRRRHDRRNGLAQQGLHHLSRLQTVLQPVDRRWLYRCPLHARPGHQLQQHDVPGTRVSEHDRDQCECRR